MSNRMLAEIIYECDNCGIVIENLPEMIDRAEKLLDLNPNEGISLAEIKDLCLPCFNRIIEARYQFEKKEA